MTLVRANWEPISRRYLQQAGEAKDPALASSLHGSVAEFYLKYRPTGPEGEAISERASSSTPAIAVRRRTSNGSCGRLAGATSCWRSIASAPSARRPARSAPPPRSWPASCASSSGVAPRRSPISRKALDANPYEPRALQAVRAALSASGAWTDLAKVLEAAARTKRGEQDVALLTELALLFDNRLNQQDMAEPFFRRVRKIDPSNREMVEFYRAYHTARNELPQLLAVLAQAQKTESDLDRRIAMGIEMGRAAEQRAQNADKAIEIWKGLLRLRPHLPEAVASLRKLYTATEKWNALLELLKDDLDAVPAADVDEKINRHLEIVAVYRDRLNLDVMVVTTYLNILSLKPDHPAALAALAGRYEAQGRYGDLVQILARQAEAAADPAARVALHRRIASLWADKLGKHQNAVASFEKISRPIRPTRRRACGSRTSTPRRAPGDRSSSFCARSSRTATRPAAARASGRWRASPASASTTRARRSPFTTRCWRSSRATKLRSPGGDAVRARAALAGAGGDPRAAAAERRGECAGGAGAARTAGNPCSTSGWPPRKRPSMSFGGSRRSIPRTPAPPARCARFTRRRATTPRSRRCTPSRAPSVSCAIS